MCVCVCNNFVMFLFQENTFREEIHNPVVDIKLVGY